MRAAAAAIKQAPHRWHHRNYEFRASHWSPIGTASVAKGPTSVTLVSHLEPVPRTLWSSPTVRHLAKPGHGMYALMTTGWVRPIASTIRSGATPRSSQLRAQHAVSRSRVGHCSMPIPACG